MASATSSSPAADPPAPTLSSRQLAGLCSVVDTLLPPLHSLHPWTARFAPPSGGDLKDGADGALHRFLSHDLCADPSYVQALTVAINLRLRSSDALQLKALLVALTTVPGSALLLGVPCASPFVDWNRDERIEALKGLRDSRLEVKRAAFNGMKRLICGVAMSYVAEGGCGISDSLDENGTKPPTNPFWEGVQYPGAHCSTLSPEEDAKKVGEGLEYDFPAQNALISPAQLEGLVERGEDEWDVIVAGSGAGGGVAAANLAGAGFRVLVLEKGPYADPTANPDGGDDPPPTVASPHRVPLTDLESKSFDRLYENSSLLTTDDGALMILAGSCVGGGTTINWGCCLDTPRWVREEWSRNVSKGGHGLVQFSPEGNSGVDFDASLERVKRRIGCDSDLSSPKNSYHNEMNLRLIRGAKTMRYDVRAAQRNFRDPSDPGAGYTCFGDRYGNKRGGCQTFLADACRTGRAKIVSGVAVDRVLWERRRGRGSRSGRSSRRVATGVVVRLPSGRALVLRARRSVVSACGSIQTPALLLRSGMANRNIGRHLHLHPVTFATGIFGNAEGAENAKSADTIRGYLSAPMTAVSDHFASGPRGDGYGCKLECPSAHTGLMAGGYQWVDPASYKSTVLRFRDTATIIVLQRDLSEGTVRLGCNGVHPVVSYRLRREDKKSMVEGVRGAIKLLIGSGAEWVTTSRADDAGFSVPAGLCAAAGTNGSDEADRKRRAEQIDSHPQLREYLSLFSPDALSPHSAGTFCAHQMGSCRMSASPSMGAVDQNGESWDCDGLFVMDTSVFPTASGSNPMVTVLAMSDLLSQRLVRKLQYEDGTSKLSPTSDGEGGAAKAATEWDERVRIRAASSHRHGLKELLQGHHLLAGVILVGALSVFVRWLGRK